MGSAVTSASAVMGLRKTEISLLLAQHRQTSSRRYSAPRPQSAEFSSPVLVHIWLHVASAHPSLSNFQLGQAHSQHHSMLLSTRTDEGGEGLVSQAGLAVVPAGTLTWLSGRLASKVRGHCSGLRRTGTPLHWPPKVPVRTYGQTRLTQMAPRPD